MSKEMIILIILTAVFFLGGHLYDIGHFWGEGCNGFWCLSSEQLEHLGGYMQYGCFLTLIFINIGGVVDGTRSSN